MFLARVFFGALTTWSAIQAITVPIDRSDVQLSPTRSSMIANGWRPLTGYDNIGTNVSPSSGLERSSAHRPVLGKLQDHPQSSSSSLDKHKQQANGLNVQDYSPPSILGSFSVFGHAATKARTKPKEHSSHSPSGTTHYSFLVPPPRDAYRFEVQDPHRKAILRDNDAFLRQPTFVSQVHQDANGSPFFSKGSGFAATSTTHSPGFPKSRPFLVSGLSSGFGVQQNVHPQRQFEAQKGSNTKSYLQPPGLESPHGFGVENKNPETGFGRFHAQPHSAQILNGGNGNFFSQVDHPSPFKSSYERDPSFLVHESHEISYVTPSSIFGNNFRPSLPYDNLVPPNLFSSTTAPKIDSNKFTGSQQSGLRNEHYKQFEASNSPQESLVKAQGLSQGLQAGSYFIQGEQSRPAASWPQQKSKFTTEINEVLPRKNPPAKFRPESVRPNPVFGLQSEPDQVIFIRPSIQTQFENPVSSGQPLQTTSSEPDYETPESISLKHFNEQQFLLQQQLVQQDRQRFQEAELQRQRQQEEEEAAARKREEEIRLQIEEQEKAAERKKLAEEEEKRRQKEREEQEIQERMKLRKQQQDQERSREQFEREKQAQLEEQKRIQEQQFNVEQEAYNRPISVQDQVPFQEVIQNSKESFEVTTEPVQPQSQVEPEVRPYKPKFPQRVSSTRRRRPSTPATYVAQATEASFQEQFVGTEMQESSVQSTAEPEVATTQVPVTHRPRIRRPGQTLRRRRPVSTTMPTPSQQETASSYVRESEPSRQQTFETEFSKRRRGRPTQTTTSTEETVTERHFIRRRPTGHRQRVHPGEPFEAEVVTEIVRPTRIIYKDTTEWENYPESFKKKDSQEIDTSSLPSRVIGAQDMEEGATEDVGQTFEFSTEAFATTEDVTQTRDEIETKVPIEKLFEKPAEENHIEPATTFEDVVEEPATTTTTTSTTTTTTEAPFTTTELVTTTRQSHRIRPLKYGNSTRPRFSIKDYRSRLDYKNRLSQLSSTEATPGRRRVSTERPDPEPTTSRNNKYNSRVAYKPTTSTSPTTNPEGADEEPTTVTERTNRFTPKRKLNASLYRSRISGSLSTSRSGPEDSRPSTRRPENIYSSAIRRARPTFGVRNQPEETTEMTAEETSFYASMTTRQPQEAAINEVGMKEEEEEVEEVTVDAEVSEPTPTRRMQEEEEQKEDAGNEPSFAVPTSTQASRDAEDAFISQRIANLTSSASELYEPGRFKAVSPATESRVINPNFAIATDEPTLPIEAFFQVLNKKDE